MNRLLTLDGIFSDGMVLQRNRPAAVWGTCPDGAAVHAELDGSSCVVNCEKGRFTVTLPSQPASTGHRLSITCEDETVTLSDVCFGEVFLLSGQSNMELPAERVMDVSGDELLQADFPLIRQFRVEPRYMFARQAESLVPHPWTRAVFPDVLELSAAGFFFARRMQEQLDVPIGLVLNAMGGSIVEAWLPEEELYSFGGEEGGLGIYAGKVLPYHEPGALEAQVSADEKAKEAWLDSLRTGDETQTACAIPSDASEYTVPGMSFGTELEGWCGSVWFWREVTLDHEPAGDGFLYVGELIDSDRTYVNGTPVGETTYRYPSRKYSVPAGVLHKGRNIIAVRLVIDNGAGGFIPDHPYYLHTGRERIDLTGKWYMKKETAAQPAPPVLFPPDLPTGLYNASLHPLRGIEFAGLLWYQGESNTWAPERYNEKFDRMMTVWREHLGQELPVVCTELCDYIDPAVKVCDTSGWKEIQRQQLRQPEVTSRCATVPAADLGESYELHPQRKAELGERLADAMLKLAYDRK